MVQGVTDVSVTPLQLQADRMRASEFTVKTWNMHIGFIFRHPRKNELENGFLKPFTQDIWWVSSVIGFIYWTLLYFTAKMELYFEGSKEPENTLMSIPGSETGLITIGAISQQGLSDAPRIAAGRIVFLSLFLWVLLLYQFYSASIVGSLLIKPPRWILTDVDVAKSSLECTFHDIPYNRLYHQTVKNPYAQEVYNTKIAPYKDRLDKVFITPEEGYPRVRKGGFAFYCDFALGYKIIANTYTEDEICDLQEVRIFKPYVTTYPVTANDAKCFNKITLKKFRRILEHGLGERLKSVWHARKPVCPESHSSKPEEMSIQEFSPAIFLLLIGLGFSLIVLGCEYIYIAFIDKTELQENESLKSLEESEVVNLKRINEDIY